jgi:threonine synthase
VIAWRLGAPIAGFTAPTTINDTVPRFFATGRVEPRPSVATLANAMDVGDPSNLERLQWLFGGDLAAMRALITSTAHTDDDVRRAMKVLHEEYKYVADPHTAIAYLGTLGTPGTSHEARATLFLATAHPAKFGEVVEPVIGHPVPMPAPLAVMLAHKRVSHRINASLGALADLL